MATAMTAPERISTPAELDEQAARTERARGPAPEWPPLPGDMARATTR